MAKKGITGLIPNHSERWTVRNRKKYSKTLMFWSLSLTPNRNENFNVLLHLQFVFHVYIFQLPLVNWTTFSTLNDFHNFLSFLEMIISWTQIHDMGNQFGKTRKIFSLTLMISFLYLLYSWRNSSFTETPQISLFL